MSGELGYWVNEKNLMLWIKIVWISCWEGWLEFEAISKIVGNNLSKKLAVNYFELLYSAALPMTTVIIECKNSHEAFLIFTYPFKAKKHTLFKSFDKFNVHFILPIKTSISSGYWQSHDARFELELSTNKWARPPIEPRKSIIFLKITYFETLNSSTKR